MGWHPPLQKQRNSLMNGVKRERGVWSVWCSWDVTTSPFPETLCFCIEGKRNVIFSHSFLSCSLTFSPSWRDLSLWGHNALHCFSTLCWLKIPSTPLAQHPLPSVGQRKERGRETKRRWGWMRDKKRGSSELQLFLFSSCWDSSTPRYDGECEAIFDGVLSYWEP